MPVSTQRIEAFDEAMTAARRRVIHIISLVALLLGLVSVEIATHLHSLRDLPQVVVWFMGCGLILFLARLWYLSRVKAIARLRQAFELGSPRILTTALTRFTFNHVIPFGYELDVELADSTATHLAFGFWGHAEAAHVLRLLQSQD